MPKVKKGPMYESSTSNGNAGYDFIDYTTAPPTSTPVATQQAQKENITRKI